MYVDKIKFHLAQGASFEKQQAGNLIVRVSWVLDESLPQPLMILSLSVFGCRVSVSVFMRGSWFDSNNNRLIHFPVMNCVYQVGVM